MSPRALEAAVFDLDGVVTRTARVHFAAWKQLFDDLLRRRPQRSGEDHRPFDEQDYRAHVDGKPRLDGVRAFLASRGISLAEGTPVDPPTAETVSALGKRKNALYLDLLDRLGVEVDESAVELIRGLRAAGVRVGVATSSRNAPALLRRAGLETLFEARVDGVVSAELGLRGKPHPDTVVECLRRLGVSAPERALLVEDAASGVEAGRAGGFGLVLGIDRGDNWLRLREAGADWVVRGLGELSVDVLVRYLAAREHLRPNALREWPAIAKVLRGRRLAVFLDYDGTLTPTVARPALDWHEGKDLRWLLEAAGQRGAFPIYLGDDATDEDAFAVLVERGLGILVTELPRPTAARYTLQNPFEVQAFLERLALLGSEVPR